MSLMTCFKTRLRGSICGDLAFDRVASLGRDHHHANFTLPKLPKTALQIIHLILSAIAFFSLGYSATLSQIRARSHRSEGATIACWHAPSVIRTRRRRTFRLAGMRNTSFQSAVAPRYEIRNTAYIISTSSIINNSDWLPHQSNRKSGNQGIFFFSAGPLTTATRRRDFADQPNDASATKRSER